MVISNKILTIPEFVITEFDCIAVQKDDKVNFFLLKPLKYPYLNVGVFFNSRECRFEKVDLLFDALVTVDDNTVLVRLADNNVLIFG